jgi:hypothetical protein
MESLFCPVHLISPPLCWPDIRWTDDDSVLILDIKYGHISLLLLEKSYLLFVDFCEGYFTGRVQRLRNSSFLIEGRSTAVEPSLPKAKGSQVLLSRGVVMSAPIFGAGKKSQPDCMSAMG